MAVVVIICGLIASGVFAWLMFSTVGKRTGKVSDSLKKLKEDCEKHKGLLTEMRSLFDKMIDVGQLREKGTEYQSIQESLKAERGRITITQAELETVEGRLRELQEIEREYEASLLETKEELNILNKKHGELAERSGGLKTQLQTSQGQIDQILDEIEISSQMQEGVDHAKEKLLITQQKIDSLLFQIEEGNEQYAIMKKRYDALDIEYAQLFEKFSETEGS